MTDQQPNQQPMQPMQPIFQMPPVTVVTSPKPPRFKRVPPPFDFGPDVRMKFVWTEALKAGNEDAAFGFTFEGRRFGPFYSGREYVVPEKVALHLQGNRKTGECMNPVVKDMPDPNNPGGMISTIVDYKPRFDVTIIGPANPETIKPKKAA